jgi:hypothetical protein
MKIEEAKKEALTTGSCELTKGVYLLTGREVLKEAEGYDDPDRITDDYSKADIIPDQLYIQACPDYFASADDDDIKKILDNN